MKRTLRCGLVICTAVVALANSTSTSVWVLHRHSSMGVHLHVVNEWQYWHGSAGSANIGHSGPVPAMLATNCDELQIYAVAQGSPMMQEVAPATPKSTATAVLWTAALINPSQHAIHRVFWRDTSGSPDGPARRLVERILSSSHTFIV